MKIRNINITNNKKSHQTKYYGVLVSCHPWSIFDYSSSELLKIGTLVRVPFRNSLVIGCVWYNKAKYDKIYKLKKVESVLGENIFNNYNISFINWMSEYTVSSLGMIFKMFLPSTQNNYSFERGVTYLRVNIRKKYVKTTPKRNSIINLLITNRFTLSEVLKKSGVSRSLLSAMIKDKTLIKYLHSERQKISKKRIVKAKYKLNNDQEKALNFLFNEMKKKESKPVYLDGVTGSGKTEVYFELIAKSFEKNEQILVLLPEIALGKQWLERFRARFHFDPIIWNSSLSLKEKTNFWLSIINGDPCIVVGTRSALFLPFCKLNLIIIDEEHDSSYKQEEGVIYNARDMAIIRAKIFKSLVVLVSATPSLETYKNVKTGKYSTVILKSRYGKSVLPNINSIDMRKEKTSLSKWLSDRVVLGISEALSKGEQVLLFLNRRGYAPLSLCGSCGYRISCKNCDSWLVHHKSIKKLLCHFCGYSEYIPIICTKCRNRESIIPFGPGVERITEEVDRLFPEYKSVTISSDTLKANDFQKVLTKIKMREVQVIIGTQVIAKGHHFPLITRVVVVDADLGLYGGDLRAFEKTFQLITQVSGRSGRGERFGDVYIQTYDPGNLIIKSILSYERNSFLESELANRKSSNLPPYARLASIIVSGKDKGKCQDYSLKVKHLISNQANIKVYGPIPSGIFFVRGKYRYRLLIKSDPLIKTQPLLKKMLKEIQRDNNIKLKVDIDPYNFF